MYWGDIFFFFNSGMEILVSVMIIPGLWPLFDLSLCMYHYHFPFLESYYQYKYIQDCDFLW